MSVEAFLEMLAVERGAARTTIEAYVRDLADYTAFLAEEGRTPETPMPRPSVAISVA